MQELHITDKTARQYTISMVDAKITILGKSYENESIPRLTEALECAISNSAPITISKDSYVQVWNCSNLISISIKV